jgi:hypothetical protein
MPTKRPRDPNQLAKRIVDIVTDPERSSDVAAPTEDGAHPVPHQPQPM